MNNLKVGKGKLSITKKKKNQKSKKSKIKKSKNQKSGPKIMSADVDQLQRKGSLLRLQVSML